MRIKKKESQCVWYNENGDVVACLQTMIAITYTVYLAYVREAYGICTSRRIDGRADANRKRSLVS